MGITILSFLTMILFLIFKSIISSSPNLNEVQPDQLTVGFLNGEENNLSVSKKSADPLTKWENASSAKNVATDPDGKIQIEKSEAQKVSEQFNAFIPNNNNNLQTQNLENVPGVIPGTEKTGIPSGESKQGFNVRGRTVISSPKFSNDTQEEGTVIVEIVVDKDGNVTEANPNGRGTTTSSPLLKSKAKELAIGTKFNADSKLGEQRGNITIVFTFN